MTKIAPAEGKLGILIPGMGAVTTTVIAGVEAIKRGLSAPIGSVTQMSTIRLGKRTDNNPSRIKDFVPLATLNDLEFGCWDIFGDNCYEAALPPRGDAKEGWDNIDIFGWMGCPMQIKVDFLCRDSILAAPLVLDLVLFMDLAQRAGMQGVQEWLSLYFKAPMTAPGLYPEHDLFIQLMKLKNTLRWMKGEQLITHLGMEYYD